MYYTAMRKYFYPLWRRSFQFSYFPTQIFCTSAGSDEPKSVSNECCPTRRALSLYCRISFYHNQIQHRQKSSKL